MIHVHQLDGCAPAPLAHYLKALGVLRLISEQGDREARGWWDGDRFRLATKLTREELVAFFLRDYQPTPMFNPWGARSGFYAGGSEKSAREFLNEIERSKNPRLAPFRSVAKTVRSVVTGTTAGKPSDKERERLINELRLQVRGTSALWLDTVLALIGAGNDMSMAQPPIFGTGGNEGSGGYPSAYMSALVNAVLKADWNHAVSVSLYGGSTAKCRWNRTMGQFAPGGNSTPWDLLFSFEGACMLRSAVGGRQATTSRRWMSSPFYVAPRSAGYASASRLDERVVNKGREQPGRGEQWFPLWSRPSSLSELQQVFLQGRAATKAGRATDGWAMAKAVSALGVSREIPEFMRYGYQQRNNQATHFAIPLGRFRVFEKKQSTTSCLDDLDRWLGSLHRDAHPGDDQKAKRVPGRLTTTHRRLMDALFAVIGEQTTAHEWQNVLLRLGDIEAVMRRGTGFNSQPVPRLRPEWIAASHNGTSEFRLALAFALQSAVYRVNGRPVQDPVRRHWLPLESERPQIPMDPERKLRFATTDTGGSQRLDVRPEVVMHGRRGLDDAVALVERRLVEASRLDRRHLPLEAAPRAAAEIGDLAELLSSRLNVDRTLALARPLMALDREAWGGQYIRMTSPRSSGWPDDAWLAIRLSMLPWPLKTRTGFVLDIGADPAIIRRLAVGDAAAAIAIALRRLAAAGVRCTVRAGTVPAETARLWVAALAFPITRGTAERFLHRLDPHKE